ncbi:MAG: amino acid ABC transporter ATP-binding protein [Christensenellales bacterium]|jgi:polar amino acid transport system ATP-binding protein
MKMIEVNRLQKAFGSEAVLKDVSFSVEKGETVAVIGYSGAGKSTMLRCLIDLEKADGGDILIEGEALVKDGRYPDEKQARRICRKMGMVFQSFNLFPHLTVMGNLIGAPVTVNKEEKQSAMARAKEKLELVGLADKAAAYPGELSGGQKQRVAIARALMMEPDMLLFDEPTSSLDPQLTAEVLAVIKQLAEKKMTMIIVTHEMGFAREVADKVVFMGEGHVIEQGPPKELFTNPKDQRVRDFIESIL